MENEGLKSCLDDDIMKVLSLFSFTKEKLIHFKNENVRLEKQLSRKNGVIEKMREAEKNHSTSLEESKKLISEQQITISKLMTVKEEIKKYKDIINTREQRILEVEQEKYTIAKKFEDKAEEIRKEYNKKNENLNEDLKELKNELNIVKSEAVCKSIKAEEDAIQAKAEKDEQINKLVLDYEEKLQRAQAQYMRMKDEMRNLIEKSNAAEIAFKERIFRLEQKQSQRTNIVKPSISRANETTKINQNRQQCPSTLAYHGNSSNLNNFQNKEYASKVERPLSRASNTSSTRFQDSAPSSNYGSFQVIPKYKSTNAQQKYNNNPQPISNTPISNIQPSSVELSAQENVEKKKTLKRKLFSKFSEEFVEND